MQKFLFASLLFCVQAIVAQTPPASPLDACLATTRADPVDIETCQTALSASAPTSVERARAHAALAIQYARMDDLRRARSAIDEALRLAPQRADIQGNLGIILLREGAYAAAVNAFNNMLANDPEMLYEPAVYLNRALALRALGRYDEAAKDYALYLDLTTLPASPSDQAPLEAPLPQVYIDSST